ncbi:MAG TPA: Cache 3/Cache 2 fusion domain-containing protein, partial [Smithellaceae bacterium]|nr:Cache 3/Cache 2 fusion domain-containing protein [Smithellaceae bacterium]
MVNFFRNLRLDIKIALLGIGIGLITAIILVSLAVWQSGQYNRLAQHEVDELIDADLDHITEGVYHLVKTENEAVGEQLNHSLRVARHILAGAGNIGFSEETVFWTATNQFTNKKTKIQIPRMTINGRWLEQNTDPAIKTPLVDDITGLIGETATLFQRMNEKGDMIRVATTVKDAQGKRAIGTFIPAVGPDGKPNPVVAAILRGNTYHGRAFVVNAWYLTAYEPIRDKAGRLIGMLYVGVRQKAVEMRIRQAIVQTKVGKTGYVYVLGGKGEDRGRYIISHRGERDGEDIWESRDSDGSYVIQMIIGKATALKPGEMTTIRYKWQNPGESFPRWKIARLAYYEPWDWVIGTSVYEDELQSYRAVLSSGRMKMTAVMGLAGLMLMMVIGLSGIFFAWTIMRPVGQLTRAAEVIMKGNLNQTVPIRSKDEIGTLAHTFNTMTERLRQTMAGLQKSETKYRTLVDTTSDLIFIVDTEGRLTFANPRLEALTGLSFHELQGKPFTDILHPEFREIEASRFEKGAGGKVIAPYEVLVIDRAGKETPVEILSATLFDPDGRPVGRFGVGRDVTERRKAADALHASEQKLKGQLLFMEALLSAMPIPVFYKDANLRYLGCNEAYSEYMGISA